jgi:sec-independent protein translocase protein TatC
MSEKDKKPPEDKTPNNNDENNNSSVPKDEGKPQSELPKDEEKKDRKKLDDSADSTEEEKDLADEKKSKEKDKSHPDEGDENVDTYDQYYEEDYYDYGEFHDDNKSAEKENEKEEKENTKGPETESGGNGSGGGDDGGDDDDDDDEEDIPEENPERKMPFLSHLEELRWTILWSLIAVLVGAIGCYIFAEELIDILLKPLPSDEALIFLSPTGGFMIYIKVAIFSGLILALPIVVWQFWKFIVPGLLDKEKKLVPPIVFFTVLCFAIGATFAYYVIIPFGLKFLLGFETEAFEANIEVGKYLGFVVTIILVFGTVFELPVLSFFLTKVGILTPEFLRAKRRYGIVIIFIMAALLTPPDIFTQLMLAGPLIMLYEISIWVSAMVRKKDKKEKENSKEDSSE